MKLNKILKTTFLAVSCIALLCGCTKSNIVRTDETLGPDFNYYPDIEIDEGQLQ